MILLWSTTMIPEARPPPCIDTSSSCSSATILQFIFLCFSFGLMSIGAGGIGSSSLAFGSGYIKGLGYGLKPPSRRITSSDLATQQLQKELQETTKATNSQVNDLMTQVAEFETEVSDLKTQLVHQGANINKLMEIMAANGMNI